MTAAPASRLWSCLCTLGTIYRESHLQGESFTGRVMQRLSLCLCLFKLSTASSRFVLVVACVRISFLSKAIPRWVYTTFYPSVCWRTFRWFSPFLWVMPLWTLVFKYLSPCFQFFWIYSHLEILFLIFLSNCLTFSTAAAPITFPLAVHKGSRFCVSSKTRVSLGCFDNSCANGCEVASQCRLDL